MPATTDVQEAVRRVWDAVVVGAGPAGSLAARALARNGTRVLLVDRQRFPRPKVCGGCLNGRTLALLDAAGLGDLPASLGGRPLDRFELRSIASDGSAAAPVEVPMPLGIAVSRTALDQALIDAAVAAGAEFIPGVRAALGNAEPGHRTVRLPDCSQHLKARIVLCADGLGGSFLAGRSAQRSRSSPASRIGAGAEVPLSAIADPEALREGVIHMGVGRAGYVGVVRVEGSRLSVAAALDPQTARSDGLGGAIGRLFTQCGLGSLDFKAVAWRGTPALTRKAPAVAFDRVLLIGDAAGYVEPFTGEGISWALETALASATLAREAIDDWGPELEQRWRRLYRRRIVRRQLWCRTVSWTVRRPSLVRTAARLLQRTPKLAAPLMDHLNAAPAGVDG